MSRIPPNRGIRIVPVRPVPGPGHQAACPHYRGKCSVLRCKYCSLTQNLVPFTDKSSGNPKKRSD